MRTFLTHGGRIAWLLVLGIALTLTSTAMLVADTATVRYERDITRMVFNDNLDLLEDVKKRVGIAGDSLAQLISGSGTAPATDQYLVISTAENRLWYKQRDSVLFETRVATGSGKTLVKSTTGSTWRFETPRGRLVVERKDLDPSWIPPDWHYEEIAAKRKLAMTPLFRGKPIPTSDGGSIAVRGSEVVKRSPGGAESILTVTDGREIVVDGKLIVPPFGTAQRKYDDVLGTHRLYLGNGYGIHGTNNPASIGQSVSHGCVRLLNQDIELLYNIVPIGTPVFIY